MRRHVARKFFGPYALIVGFVVVSIFFTKVVAGRESGLVLKLELDSTTIRCGEAVSGAVTLQRDFKFSGPVSYCGNQVFSDIYYQVKSGSEIIHIRPYEGFGLMLGNREPKEILWGDSHALQDLVFLQSYWAGGGIDNVATRYSEIVAKGPGRLEVTAFLVLVMERGEFESIVSNSVLVEVLDEGEGFPKYMEDIGYLPIYKPLTRCPLVSLDDLDSYGDYRSAIEKVVSYQYGIRIKQLLYGANYDDRRSPEHTLGLIVDGMVGDETLWANRWRRALLVRYSEVYGVPVNEKINGSDVEAQSLLRMIPATAP